VNVNQLIAAATEKLDVTVPHAEVSVQHGDIVCKMTYTPARWRSPARVAVQFKKDGKVVSKASLLAAEHAQTTSLVADVIRPLKEDAMRHAAEQAARDCDRAIAVLEAEGWVLPEYPHGRMGRAEYRRAIEKRNWLSSVSKPWAKELRAPCEEGIARVVAREREAAGFSFDAYIVKLVTKVGAVDSANVVGMFLWQGSTLTVVKGSATEHWHTQQIINVSSLGKLFNQWPTRLLK
jgi:hypothetical protein